jgi:hypothetical protein
MYWAQQEELRIEEVNQRALQEAEYHRIMVETERARLDLVRVEEEEAVKERRVTTEYIKLHAQSAKERENEQREMEEKEHARKMAEEQVKREHQMQRDREERRRLKEKREQEAAEAAAAAAIQKKSAWSLTKFKLNSNPQHPPQEEPQQQQRPGSRGPGGEVYDQYQQQQRPGSRGSGGEGYDQYQQQQHQVSFPPGHPAHGGQQGYDPRYSQGGYDPRGMPPPRDSYGSWGESPRVNLRFQMDPSWNDGPLIRPGRKLLRIRKLRHMIRGPSMPGELRDCILVVFNDVCALCKHNPQTGILRVLFRPMLRSMVWCEITTFDPSLLLFHFGTMPDIFLLASNRAEASFWELRLPRPK